MTEQQKVDMFQAFLVPFRNEIEKMLAIAANEGQQGEVFARAAAVYQAGFLLREAGELVFTQATDGMAEKDRAELKSLLERNMKPILAEVHAMMLGEELGFPVDPVPEPTAP